MSPRARPARLLALAASAFCLVAAAPTAASAYSRIDDFPLPSTHGNIDESTVLLNKVTSLRASVILPDGYDENPGKKWPVLYLLQGMGDNAAAWTKKGSGDATNTAKGFPGIVVSPEGGRGFFMDWWEGGQRNGPKWMSYYLDDVIPTIESKYRIAPGRENHIIGGASMGGYGALLLGGQLPGYFGSIISLSGLVDTQSPDVQLALPDAMQAPYKTVWGDPTGQYAIANNPIKTIMNVKYSRQYLSSGNGTFDLRLPWTKDSLTKGVIIEASVAVQNLHYENLAVKSGVDTTLHVTQGVHDWPYWERELPKALSWTLAKGPAVTSSAGPKTWVYKTMQPHGNAWGLGYSFATPTTQTVTIARDGQQLKVGGGSNTITINPGATDYDASGAGSKPQCSVTVKLPATVNLPAGC